VDARAAITGLAVSTTPIEILHASLEAVALTFRDVYELMLSSLGAPKEVIASGGGLLHSPSWTKIMADTLDHTVIPCLEPEATSRGAALVAMERIGAIRDIGDLAPSLATEVRADGTRKQIYTAATEQQRQLYKKLFDT
jgi:gluconokinase